MKTVKLVLVLFFALGCAGKETSHLLTKDVILVASTPCDHLIRTRLSIPHAGVIDYMKWNLVLREDKTFSLDLEYGEAEPNTSGFKKNHQLSYKGLYSISRKKGVEVYQLNAKQPIMSVRFIKLTDNTFHLLTPDNKLMVGNGGWSYTLNNKVPAKENTIPGFLTLRAIPDSSLQVTYDGRTPCENKIVTHHRFSVTASCFKLKWRLILNRDSITRQPSTYALGTVLNSKLEFVYGKWEILKESDGNGEIALLKLMPDKGAEAVYFLIGDENVLFFLDQQKRLINGNADFSYTLNRKQVP